MTEDGYLLLMNIIFLMDGVFNCKTHLMDSPIYMSRNSVISYRNLGRFFRALMNIHVECMTYLYQQVIYS